MNYRSETIKIDDFEITITFKKIRNIILRVGRQGLVSVSAPYRLSKKRVIDFILSRIQWIRRHREKALSRPVGNTRCFDNGSFLEILGRRYLVKTVVSSGNRNPQLLVEDDGTDVPVLSFVHGGGIEVSRKLLEKWCRQMLMETLEVLFDTWQSRLCLRAERIGIRKMKTRWGSCNIRKKTISINLELVFLPCDCLEYIVVHELAHLAHPYHNREFYLFMDTHLSDWQMRRSFLKNISISGF